ncbi:MAG: ribosome silencing factor [Bryobacteraceae bacterium]|nr:ribosome silencing factor [Bryobacteraceae bacterium]
MAPIVVRYSAGAVLLRIPRAEQTESWQGRPLAEAETPSWLVAVRAAESKKAGDIRVLDLRGVASFTDFFVLCTAYNPRQSQAISDEIVTQLKKRGETPLSLEGYEHAEWILADYGDYIVHIFSERARLYYDLERLWRHAKVVPVPPA